MNASQFQAGRHVLRLAVLVVLASSALLAGCAHTTPDWDAHFGDAARIALAQQVADPQAARKAGPAAGMDGRAARAAYERYQKSFNEAAAQPAPLVGGSVR